MSHAIPLSDAENAAKSLSTVAERIVASLQRHGIDCFFGQSLPSKLVLACEEAGIRQISYRQENMGGAMADAFARLSGRIGMVVAQNGPAATLLVPPMAEAMKAAVPMIAFVQEVETPTVDRNAFQELDHHALFHGVTKFVRRLDDPARIEDYVDMAITAATSGRPGPAVLLLPADVLRGRAAPAPFHRSLSLGHWPLDRAGAARETVMEAARLIAGAKAPVVIAGGGVHASDAAEALTRVMEAAHLPVFTTNMGKGSVDETHPLAGGVQGAINARRSIARQTRALLKDADLVLLVGTRTNQNGTDNWKILNPDACFIHIDIDPMEIGRTYEAIRLQGDARETLDLLHQALLEQDLTTRTTARADIEARLAAAWQAFEQERADTYAAQSTPIRPEFIMARLQDALTPETVVVADASYSSMWVAGHLRGCHPGARFILPRGLAGLGWGFPFGLGAAVARPGAPVIAVVGDGGFAHSWAELETAARHDLPLVTILLNNGILGFQKDAETVKFGAWTTAVHFAPVDHAAIARAAGIASERIEDPARIGPALEAALASRKPHFLEVMVDPDARPALSLFAEILDA